MLAAQMVLADLKPEPEEPQVHAVGDGALRKKLERAYQSGSKRDKEYAGHILYPEKHPLRKCKECDNNCPPGKVCCSAECWRKYGDRTRV